MTIFKILDELNLPQANYVVVGGGVMEALGMKSTEDLDIVVTETLFNTFLQSGDWIVTYTPNGKKKLKKYIHKEHFKKIEIYLDVNTSDFNPTTQELIERSMPIKGFSFISLPDLINFKKAYGRPKDKLDLELINKKFSQYTS